MLNNKPTKEELDNLAKKYETKDFILSDPVQFPHKFKTRSDIEIIAFITSLLSYGKRELFIAKLNQLLDIMEFEPTNFIKSFKSNYIKDFNYRFGKPNDFISIFNSLKILYKTSNLEELFSKNTNSILNKEFEVVKFFYDTKLTEANQGFYFMLPNPEKGGAMKRMNMFLRWMIRKSDVDLGIWSNISKENLLIPLDVHVGNVARNLNLLTRKSNDIKAVIELTNKLKEYCPEDPVKYDFALFGYGVNNK